MEEPDPQNQALQNPIILQQILQHVPKTARPVCHFWNDIALSLPHPRLTLHLDSGDHCCNPTPFQSLCLKMEPRLARSISEHAAIDYCDHGAAGSSFRLYVSIASKLLHVSGQFGHFIENFTIIFEDDENIQTMYEILGNCPNLKRVNITFMAGLVRNGEEFNDIPTVCTLHKLISLKINDGTDNPYFSKMTQWLLNSAPNLTHLFLEDNQLPELGRNGAIKRFDLTMNCSKISDIQGADHIRKVNKILDRIKDTVEFFYLKIELFDAEGNVGSCPVDLHIPKMKNLKEFGNSGLDLFSCGDKLQNICTARIPTLQSLKISKSLYYPDGLTNLLRNIIEEKDLFSGVKNLHVKNLHDPKLIAGLRTPFPALERLSNAHWGKNACPFTEMEPYLRAYAALGLKYLEIQLAPRTSAHRQTFSDFMQGFANFGELLADLKTLKIRFSDGQTGFSDGLDLVEGGVAQMKKWLLGMKGFEDVIIAGIQLKRKTWKWVEPFIRENKIPIVFKAY